MSSAAPQLLVDAHNLCYRHAELGPLLRREPEAGRQELERRLQGRRGLWLFYDGGPHGEARHSVRHGLQIVYSGHRQADDCIVDWLHRHAGRRAVVVTADADLRRRSAPFGARCLHPDEFISRYLRRPGKGELDEAAGRGPPAPDEVAFWLRAFGVEDD